MNILDGALDLLYPPRCGVCGDLRQPVVCADCLDRFRTITGPVCSQCGRPGADCAFCARSPSPIRSPYRYDGAAGAAVRRLKYERVFGLGARLGELLGEFALASRLFAGTEMVIPVPIHTSRMRHRSFNQSELLAAPVAAALQAELAATMVRWRRTPPQVGLQADQREQNVAGAFRVQGSVSGAKVLLIDDVYTSGFTLIECAKTLNQAGATAVAALTLCREV